ncbi:2-octaprenyl-6-methoxyphenol hydroxylase [Aliiroseovarius halocynthiae]|uniref:UbiH/UbiF family hydroxylase n=1 Tax=Aliiroseovarius halocynthiae TaxID=985055 RepID=A0A545SRB1_9RHOB|nr:FAD-dependent monooxygenase [Aliiroseovarius halocynthiae]TQV67502.1 UbiH/UbiF family hydroxylase [Aliiroseovarius halocynthiae]SMR81512.1 2-octaprenyl-6-methoxyphenol hydroxylase [Aliiroseovarius halocynthiae]
MTEHRADIFISGGGIAGQVTAAGFAAARFSVVMADPFVPVTTANEEKSDLRSTAFLRPARQLFDRVGLWPRLKDHAKPLDQLAVIDTTGWPPEIRDRRVFRSDDMGDDPFGWNLMNWVVRREIWTYLQEQPLITPLYGTGFRSIVQRTDEIIVTLTNGDRVRARMGIAADGKFSPLRETAGITVSTTRYGQKSLAFTVTHDLPHGNISTEIYNEGGPFTIVPLPDMGGKHASAIVWMNQGPRAVELMNMDVPEFEDVMFQRSTGLLGRMHLQGNRSVWPIITQTADQLTSGRVAVVAEAAHALPPIGAQGLNTSLNDVIALLELAEATPNALGDPAMMKAYDAARGPDIARRARAIDLFNRVTRSGDGVMQTVRLLGLKAVHDVGPMRKRVMRAGLGPN